MKQEQHHGKRAPKGKPEKTVRFGFRCSPAEHRKIMRHGGSQWLRELLRLAS